MAAMRNRVEENTIKKDKHQVFSHLQNLDFFLRHEMRWVLIYVEKRPAEGDERIMGWGRLPKDIVYRLVKAAAGPVLFR